MNIEIVTNTINASNWPESQKKALILILPNFGNTFLEFIDNIVFSFHSELESKYIISFCEDAADAFNKLKEGDISKIERLISNGVDSSKTNFGSYLLPLIIDIHKLVNTGKIQINPDLDMLMTRVEIFLFQKLPNFEVEYLIRTRIIYLFLKSSLLLEIKEYFVFKKKQNSEWLKKITASLLGNVELLSNKNIRIENKELPPNVKNWILDYTVSIPKPMSERSSYDEIRYIKNSKNVLKLNEQEKTVLFEIIKLYNWLLSPTINLKEIEEYRSNKVNDWVKLNEGTREEEVFSYSKGGSLEKPKEYLDSQILDTEIPNAGLVLSGRNTKLISDIGTKAKTEEAKNYELLINQKLEDLKKKVK